MFVHKDLQTEHSLI